MLWQIGLDGKNRRPFLTVPDGDGGLDMPGFSPDGKRLSFISYRGPGLRSQVWTFGLPNGPWRQLTDTDEGAYDPAWSPDGTRIAYVVRSGGKHDLWVMDADGTGQRQITGSGVCRAPCWSPDGQYLAYVAAEGNTFDVWAMAAPAKSSETAAGSTSGISSPSSPVTASTTSSAAPPAARLTRGAQIDTVSGLSWTK
jgi:TolB protein